MSQPKTPPRLSVQVDPKMLRRCQRLHRAERMVRPYLSFSDVLRELIEAGLQQRETLVAPEDARAAGAL